MRLRVLAVLLLIAGCKKSSDSGFGSAPPAGPSLPAAVASDDQKVLVSTLVTLKGDKSHDTPTGAVTHLWAQVGGTATVTLTSATAANPTFNAPATADTLRFLLTVTGVNGTDTDSVEVAVKTTIVTAPDTWWVGYEKPGTTITAVATGVAPASYQWSGMEAWLTYSGETTATLTCSTPKLTDFQNFPDLATVAVLERSTQGRLQLTVTAKDGAGAVLDEDTVNFSAGPFADSVANENVTFGEPVFLNGAATPSTWTWTGTKPSGSVISFFKPDKTALAAATDQRFVYFVPDQVGPYEIILTQNPGSVVKVINLTCGKYIGVGNLIGKTPDPFKGECAACHGGQLGFLADFATTWKATGHASMFERILDPSNPYYSPSQAKGHWNDAFNFGSNYSIDSRTVGWSRITSGSSSGWVEHATAEGYVFKDTPWSEVVRKFPNTAAKSNVQCESCHGPGSEHAGDTTGIRKSYDSNACGRCHSRKQDLWEASSHGKPPITSPSGSGSCNNCHTAQGFVVDLRALEGTDPLPVLFASSNVNRPVIPLEDRRGTTCQVCHDPHKKTPGLNSAGPDPQLRAFGDVQFRNGTVWNAGQAAVCAMCHHSRTDTRANSTDMNVRRAPHDSTAAEMLAGSNGQQFSGWAYASSPHGIASRFIAPGRSENRQCLSCHGDVQPGQGALGYNALGGHTFHMTQGDGTVIAGNSTHTSATADGAKKILAVATGPSFLKKVFTGDTLLLDGVPNEVANVDGARQLTLLNPPAAGPVTTWTLTSLKKYNVGACTQCHTTALDFKNAARGNFDGDGALEAVQDEIAGLQTALLGAINAKLAVLTGGANTLLVESGRIKYTDGGLPAVKRTFPGPNVTASEQPIAWSSLTPTQQAEWLALYQAAYNHVFVQNDKSAGIHNTGYAVNLLQASYKAVTGLTLGAPYVPY